MNISKPVLILISIALNIILFMAGIQYGIYQFGIVDSPYRAYMTTVQLESIKNGKCDLIKRIQEEKLTDEIVNYGKFLDHGKAWLFWPQITEKPIGFMEDTITQEECIEKAIKYRKENPIQVPYDLSVCSGENKDSDFCKVILQRQFYYDKALLEKGP